MTHEEFVSLETAKLLRKAGFDWECRYFYDTWASPTLFDDNTGKMQYERHTGTDFKNDVVCKNYNARNSDGTFGAFVSVPTQAVVQRWLREVKGILIEVCRGIVRVKEHDSSIANKWTYSVCHLNSNKRDILPSDEFDTYEAALEAGLQKCLTLILEE